MRTCKSGRAGRGEEYRPVTPAAATDSHGSAGGLLLSDMYAGLNEGAQVGCPRVFHFGECSTRR
jgi:hypothetical protein